VIILFRLAVVAKLSDVGGDLGVVGGDSPCLAAGPEVIAGIKAERGGQAEGAGRFLGEG